MENTNLDAFLDIRDITIRSKVLIAENLSKLEDIIEPELSLLNNIYSEKKTKEKKYFNLFRRNKKTIKNNFENSVDYYEFENELFPKIKSIVDYLLNVNDIKYPFFSIFPGHNDSYNQKFGIINLDNSHKAKMITKAAHEYVHHVCNVKGITDNYTIFHEGLARAIEKKVSEEYAKKENDKIFLLNITENIIDDLISSYIWTCLNLKIVPKESITANVNLNKTELLNKYNNYVSYIIGPNKHSIGTSFMLLNEKQYGDEIYKNIFDNLLK